jgi:hypothetical protein
MIWDVWHRKIRVRSDKPERFFDAILNPSIPRWQYLPRGPFQLLRFAVEDATIMYGYDDQPTLDLILAEFVRLHLPRLDEGCFVLDLDHQIVLSWIHTETGCHWAGCEKAYLALERYADPLDVAWWRDSAMSHNLHQSLEAPHE